MQGEESDRMQIQSTENIRLKLNLTEINTKTAPIMVIDEPQRQT